MVERTISIKVQEEGVTKVRKAISGLRTVVQNTTKDVEDLEKAIAQLNTNSATISKNLDALISKIDDTKTAMSSVPGKVSGGVQSPSASQIKQPPNVEEVISKAEKAAMRSMTSKLLLSTSGGLYIPAVSDKFKKSLLERVLREITSYTGKKGLPTSENIGELNTASNRVTSELIRILEIAASEPNMHFTQEKEVLKLLKDDISTKIHTTKPPVVEQKSREALPQTMADQLLQNALLYATKGTTTRDIAEKALRDAKKKSDALAKAKKKIEEFQKRPKSREELLRRSDLLRSKTPWYFDNPILAKFLSGQKLTEEEQSILQLSPLFSPPTTPGINIDMLRKSVPTGGFGHPAGEGFGRFVYPLPKYIPLGKGELPSSIIELTRQQINDLEEKEKKQSIPKLIGQQVGLNLGEERVKVVGKPKISLPSSIVNKRLQYFTNIDWIKSTYGNIPKETTALANKYLNELHPEIKNLARIKELSAVASITGEGKYKGTSGIIEIPFGTTPKELDKRAVQHEGIHATEIDKVFLEAFVSTYKTPRSSLKEITSRIPKGKNLLNAFIDHYKEIYKDREDKDSAVIQEVSAVFLASYDTRLVKWATNLKKILRDIVPDSGSDLPDSEDIKPLFSMFTDVKERFTEKVKPRRGQRPLLYDKKTGSIIDAYVDKLKDIMKVEPDIGGYRAWKALKEVGYTGGMSLVSKKMREIREELYDPETDLSEIKQRFIEELSKMKPATLEKRRRRILISTKRREPELWKTQEEKEAEIIGDKTESRRPFKDATAYLQDVIKQTQIEKWQKPDIITKKKPGIWAGVKEMVTGGEDIGKVIDKLATKGGTLGRLGWVFTSLAMSSLGVYFSLIGIVTMLQKGIGTVLGPLQNLEGIIEGFAYNQMKLAGTSLDLDKIMKQLGIDFGDVAEASFFLKAIMGTVQGMFAAFGTMILLDPDVKDSIYEIVEALKVFLFEVDKQGKVIGINKELLTLIKGVFKGLAEAMPTVLNAFMLLGNLIKNYILPNVAFFATAWAAAIVLMPIFSFLSAIANVVKAFAALVGAVNAFRAAMIAAFETTSFVRAFVAVFDPMTQAARLGGAAAGAAYVSGFALGLTGIWAIEKAGGFKAIRQLGSDVGSDVFGTPKREVPDLEHSTWDLIAYITGKPSFITKAIEGKAGGGPLRAGQVALVGEKGPEIIISKGEAEVIPNSNIRKLAEGTMSSLYTDSSIKANTVAVREDTAATNHLADILTKGTSPMMLGQTAIGGGPTAETLRQAGPYTMIQGNKSWTMGTSVAAREQYTTINKEAMGTPDVNIQQSKSSIIEKITAILAVGTIASIALKGGGLTAAKSVLSGIPAKIGGIFGGGAGTAAEVSGGYTIGGTTGTGAMAPGAAGITAGGAAAAAGGAGLSILGAYLHGRYLTPTGIAQTQGRMYQRAAAGVGIEGSLDKYEPMNISTDYAEGRRERFGKLMAFGRGIREAIKGKGKPFPEQQDYTEQIKQAAKGMPPYAAQSTTAKSIQEYKENKKVWDELNTGIKSGNELSTILNREQKDSNYNIKSLLSGILNATQGINSKVGNIEKSTTATGTGAGAGAGARAGDITGWGELPASARHKRTTPTMEDLRKQWGPGGTGWAGLKTEKQTGSQVGGGAPSVSYGGYDPYQGSSQGNGTWKNFGTKENVDWWYLDFTGTYFHGDSGGKSKSLKESPSAVTTQKKSTAGTPKGGMPTGISYANLREQTTGMKGDRLSITSKPVMTRESMFMETAGGRGLFDLSDFSLTKARKAQEAAAASEARRTKYANVSDTDYMKAMYSLGPEAVWRSMYGSAPMPAGWKPPSLDIGGLITKTGGVLAHAGEAITPISKITDLMKMSGSQAPPADTKPNQDITISITINGNATKDVTDDMVRKIKKELFGRGVY